MNKTRDTGTTEYYQVIVIGAGPAGLAAAAGALREGAERVLVLEREAHVGGILNQCIHDGFGIIRYGQQLSGPEYARKSAEEAGLAYALRGGTGNEAADESGSVQVMTSAIAVGIDPEAMKVTVLSQEGLQVFCAGAVVLATGCRERTRGMIGVPGSRPAGVLTAGVAQNLMNLRNVMPGKEIVILGSGDIGLIMARRLSLEGAVVRAVVEIMKDPQGLSRNVRQCVLDYGIPLYTSHTVSNIYGKKRLEAVDVAAVDENLEPVPGTERRIECDTLILSVGLIPENEVAETAGAALDPATNGTVTDAYLQTGTAGVFSCGNCRSVMDLADYVSWQGEAAGANAARYAAGLPLRPWEDRHHNAARKGMPEEGSVTCTLCPNGCQVKAVLEEGEWKTEGNLCSKGEAFAITEMTRPVRILTSTVRTADEPGRLLPVRTSRPVPLDRMMELMPLVRAARVQAPVEAGQVIIEDIGGTGADLIAEADL